MEIHNFWPNRYTIVNVSLIYELNAVWTSKDCFPPLKTEKIIWTKDSQYFGVRFTRTKDPEKLSYYCVSVNSYCFRNKDYILKHKIYNKHSFRPKTADIISLAYLWKTYEWKWKKHITESIMEIVFMRNIFCSRVILSDVENFEWAFG